LQDLHAAPEYAIREAIIQAADQVLLDPDFLLAVNLSAMRLPVDLKNTGWVRHSIESALWAVQTTRSFEEALVKVVNLGNDADTAGCLTGALAGALYGLHNIPQRWRQALHGEYPIRSGKLWFEADFIRLADDLAQLGENHPIN
jgi:ADP-ribosyl-[dinitrogen reductase] hydrolase